MNFPAGQLLARHTRVRSLLVETLIIVAGVVVYFGVRGQTEGSEAAAVEHAHDIFELEQRLLLDVEKGLQALVVPSDAFSTFFNWIYIWGHWPVIAVTLVVLALRNQLVYYRLRNAMLVSGGLGLLVFTTYPVAPPRLAGLGFVDTVTERSHSYRVLQPPQFVNQYAAMPSLHVGWDLLVGIAILSAATALWLRLIGALMPVLMALATVATANHYVLDAVAGACFALAGLAGALLLERRRAARRAAAVEPVPAVVDLTSAAVVDLRQGKPRTAVVPAQRQADDEPSGASGPPGEVCSQRQP